MYGSIGILFLVVITLTEGELQADESRDPLRIVVITSDQYPMSNGIGNDRGDFTIEVLNLDAVADFEQILGSRLPANEHQALALVKQRIANIGQSQLNTELHHAYQALSAAMSYGMDRYPAIIIDQQVILYGVTDLALAIKKYRQWVKASREEVTYE